MVRVKQPLMSPKILMVSGKGGVGKSTVAMAAGQCLAQQGRRTLVVEFTEQSHLFAIHSATSSYEPIEVGPNLWLAQWTGEACLREFIAHYVRLEQVVNLFFENRAMRSLIRAAPALRELALLGKATSGNRQIGPRLEFDQIVVDSYATGHFFSLMQTPAAMAETIQFGPMGEQSRAIDAVLKNPQITEYWVVTLPEELPVSEGIEMGQKLSLMGLQYKVLCNRWIENLDLLGSQSQEAGSKLYESWPGSAGFLDSLRIKHQRQQQAERRLQSAGFQPLYLPQIWSHDPRQQIGQLANKLEQLWTS